VNDSTVQAFMRQSPAEVIDWTKRCIVELIQSVIDDVNKGRIFAYLTRWRDPEELYRSRHAKSFRKNHVEIPAHN
jgi:hypothetical protein